MNEYNLAELAQTLFEESGDALFLFDPGTEQLVDVNPMAQRLSGYPRVELLRLTVRYLFRSEVQGGLNRLRAAYQKTGLFHSQEGFLLRHQANDVWVPVNLTVMRLHTRPQTLGLITARDVSERRQTQALLRKKETQLREVLSSVSDCLWSAEVGDQGSLVGRYRSPVAESSTGFSVETFTSPARWVEISHPDDRPLLQGALRKLLARSSPREEVEVRVLAADGERWLRFCILASENAERRCLVVDGVVSDVTQRRRADEQVRVGETRYQTLVDNLVQCVFLKDADLRFTAVNRSFCQEFELTEAEILGKTDLDLFPKPLAQRYRQDDRIVLEGQHLEQEETALLRGQERAVRTVKTPVRDSAGRVVGVLGIFWDVTEQRRLEEQLRQAGKMEAVGQLAGGIAHDFNNLLTGILGNLALVQMQVEMDSPLKAMIGTAEQAAWRAATLTGQLLGFSRRTILRVEPLILNATIDEVVALIQRTLDPRILLRTIQPADLWTVQADPGMMSQVVMNLCLNARDALVDVLARPGGFAEGLLWLETANVVLGEVEAAQQHMTARAGEYVRLRISDTGCGIPPDIRSRIFEPFFTTKGPDKGTGLGLAMVFGIVQQHHGWIECHSVVGQGTSFDIYLPRAADATPSPQVAPLALPGGGTETILVADDEASLRSLGEMILASYGYRVVVAEDGLQAVEMYRRLGTEIGLVVLDLTMPRLSGRDALRQIREINPQARIVFTSGYSAEYLAEEDQREIQGFVAKPFRPDSLARAVREALDGPEAGPA